MSIARQSARNFAWMMALVAIKAGTLFLSAYLLQSEGRGLLSLAYVIPGVIGIFGGLGLETAACYFIGKDEANTPKIASSAIWSTFALGVLFALLIYFAYEHVEGVINPSVSPLLRNLVLLQVPLAMTGTVFASFFVHRRWFGRKSAIEILRVIMNMLGLLILGLLVIPNSLPLVLAESLAFVHFAVALLGFGLGLYFLRDWLARPAFGLFRAMLKFGWASTLGASAMYLLHYGDQYLIGIFGGEDSVKLVGVYTAAFVLLHSLSGVSRSIASVMFRVSVEADAKENDRLVAQNGRRTTLLMLALACLAAAGTPLIVWLLPVEFAEVQTLFPILLISAPLYAMSQMAELITVNRGRFLLASGPSLVAITVNFGLNALWIPDFGAHGAAWATVVGFAVLLAGRLLIVKRIASAGVLSELFAFSVEDIRFLVRKAFSLLRREEATKDA